jgi:hypothetical protein
MQTESRSSYGCQSGRDPGVTFLPSGSSLACTRWRGAQRALICDAASRCHLVLLHPCLPLSTRPEVLHLCTTQAHIEYPTSTLSVSTYLQSGYAAAKHAWSASCASLSARLGLLVRHSLYCGRDQDVRAHIERRLEFNLNYQGCGVASGGRPSDVGLVRERGQSFKWYNCNTLVPIDSSTTE